MEEPSTFDPRVAVRSDDRRSTQERLADAYAVGTIKACLDTISPYSYHYLKKYMAGELEETRPELRESV